MTPAFQTTGGDGADARVFELAIRSDVNEIEGVVEKVQRECEAMRFARTQVMLNLPVALTEALSNAILRGNMDDRDKYVRVHVRVDTMSLVVDVMDEGGGFDLEACLLDPTTPDRVQSEDGRGLFLMHKLMDRVERFAGGVDGAGNVVRLTLRRGS
ncbi:MAG TPA: ATP-binding protein [Gemmatimonadaceae bacterium]